MDTTKTAIKLPITTPTKIVLLVADSVQIASAGRNKDIAVEAPRSRFEERVIDLFGSSRTKLERPASQKEKLRPPGV
jgi:hypothetical protein